MVCGIFAAFGPFWPGIPHEGMKHHSTMNTPTAKSLRCILSLTTLTLALMSQPLSAGKPAGGGGGGAAVPAGTLYYSVYLGEGISQTCVMKADGTQKTAIPIGHAGSPSRLIHGGQRWFLKKQQLPGQLNLAGWTRAEVFAVREDGASIQLTDDPAVTISLDWTPVETAGDALVAGVATRWNEDGTADPASIGVYLATLRFDADGNVTGLDAAPEFLVSVGVANGNVADCERFSFSPDMTRLVADHYNYGVGLPGLRMVNVATGVSTPFVAGPAREPSWSPDGTKIAFRLPDFYGRGDKIDVVAPNGAGRATVFKARYDYLYNPIWSPDSAFVAFTYQSHDGFYGNSYIYRASVVGAPNAVNLTADLVAPRLMGWR
jgi:hypothetical protein